ncbi:MAG: hypothetical protein ACFFER_02685 [Candidatus Thorarchaeota archaeon]
MSSEFEEGITASLDELDKLGTPDFTELAAVEDPQEVIPFYDGLFFSEEGEILSTNSRELGSFILNSAMLSLPVDKLENIVEKGTTDYLQLRMYRWIMEATPQVSAFQKVFPIIPSENVGRFYALYILSLSAYIDSFIEHLMKRVVEDQVVCFKIVQTLEKSIGTIITLRDLKGYDKSPTKVLSRIVYRHAPRSAVARLDMILQAIGVKDLVRQCLKGKGLENCRNDLKKFIEIRGKVAHSNPSITAEAFLQEYRDEILAKNRTFFTGILPQLEEDLANSLLLRSVKNVLQGLTDQMVMSFAVPMKSLSYPAVVDRVLTIVRPDLMKS